MKKNKISILLVLTMLLGIWGCSSSDEKESSTSHNDNNTSNVNKEPVETQKPTLGSTVTFDGLEITLDETYSFLTIDNEFSDQNGASVIQLGATIKNVSDDKNSLNMFFYNTFGAQGTVTDSVSAYFDESVDFAGDLKPGASYYKYFYILYDGDGTYSLDFDNYSQEVSVEFDIVK